MSIAQRAIAASGQPMVQEVPEVERLKQKMIEAEGDMPDSHAERRVKASPDWATYIREMVDARTDANLKKAQMQFLQMRFTEWQDANASARAEMRLGR